MNINDYAVFEDLIVDLSQIAAISWQGEGPNRQMVVSFSGGNNEFFDERKGTVLWKMFREFISKQQYSVSRSA